MKLFSRQNARRPLWLLATLWPLGLLTPVIPYVPTPFPTTATWRQELWLMLLLGLTLLLLLLKRRRAGGACRPCIPRHELCLQALLALFVSWNAASLLWAASPFHALYQTIVWGAYLLCFLLLCRVASQPRLIRASLLGLAATIWIVSIANTIEFWGSSGVKLRYLLGLGEPTAVAVPLFAALALHVRRRRAATLCGATTVLAWLTTLQALQRAPLISAGVALVAIAIAMMSSGRFRPRNARRPVLLLAALIAVTTLQSLPPLSTQGPPSSIARIKLSETTEPSVTGRLLYWGTGLEMLRAHPFTGVGAGNYEVVFASARGEFAARHPDSPLVDMWDESLPQRAHNEYVQLLAELGAPGLALFAAFCAMLVWLAGRALRRARNPLPALGASGSLLTFALCSGASPVSFHWLGSGLLFFFAAALVLRCAVDATRVSKLFVITPVRLRLATAGAFVFALTLLCGMSIQAVSATLQGAAQWTSDAASARHLYQTSLRWNPFDPATHYNYGVFLLNEDQAERAVLHLRYAAARGYNSSTCYGYVVTAETRAGNLAAAADTAAQAVDAYPRSIFLRVRYASALHRLGKAEEAAKQYQTACSMDERMARGWWHLVNFGLETATKAAGKDASIALPGELAPEICIFTVLDNKKTSAVAFDTHVDGL